MSVAVEQLLQQNSARLWRARETGSSAAAAVPAGLPTGYAALDRCLPGAGWPRQGLIEILADQRGIGELRLLLPALAALCRDAGAADAIDPPPRPDHAGSAMPPHDRGSGGWIAWVSPPYRPYAPSLAAWGIDVGRMLVVNGAGATELTAETVAKVRDAFTNNTDALWAAVTSTDANRKYVGGKFVPDVKDADYEIIRSMYRAVGIESFNEFAGG